MNLFVRFFVCPGHASCYLLIRRWRLFFRKDVFAPELELGVSCERFIVCFGAVSHVCTLASSSSVSPFILFLLANKAAVALGG